MRRVSKKRAAENRKRRAIMPGYPLCDIRFVLLLARGLDRADREMVSAAIKACGRFSDGCHERRKRSAGGALSGPNIMGACNPCNGWVEDQPRIAHALGLVVRSGDPEWEELAAAPTKIVRAGLSRSAGPRSLP